MYLLMELNQETPRLGPFQRYRVLWETNDGTARFCLVKTDKSEVYGQSQTFEDEASARRIMQKMPVEGAKIVHLWRVPVTRSEAVLTTVLKGLLVSCDTNDIELIARVSG